MLYWYIALLNKAAQVYKDSLAKAPFSSSEFEESTAFSPSSLSSASAATIPSALSGTLDDPFTFFPTFEPSSISYIERLHTQVLQPLFECVWLRVWAKCIDVLSHELSVFMYYLKWMINDFIVPFKVN